ncbi:MAG TPA: HEPN domain-containing protein [Candidatus Acidoferrum sp.]|nr:HEPN domain-containing protein [Candidatus Acidoferrum sp.]
MGLIRKSPTHAIFKDLAQKRFQEAQILLNSLEYSGAYYLSGYAVEFALKACYCKGVSKHSFPDKEIVKKLYSHILNELLMVSNIKSAFDAEVKSNIQLQTCWEVTKDWSEKSRYQVIKKSDAESMVQSVEIVLNWIKTLW